MVFNKVLSVLFLLAYAYQVFYVLVVLKNRKNREETRKDTGNETASQNTYAVLICARNEEAVIANLIGDLRKQTYDPSRVDIFVLADNCTDNTAVIARGCGAQVYERHDLQHIGEGYALEAVMKHIREDYPDGYDGYFVFDADNRLPENFISEMDKTFSGGYEIVTGFRSTVNFSDNWLSAGASTWFLWESGYLNRARSILRTTCRVSGTGFLFSRALAEEMGPWPFHMLTEDTQFSIWCALHNKRIGFCPRAVFYDEQPVSFRQSCRQRLRWSHGYLELLPVYGRQLLKGIFSGSFACYDLTMDIFSMACLTLTSVLLNTITAVSLLLKGSAAFLAWAASAAKALLIIHIGTTLVALLALTGSRDKFTRDCSTGRMILYLLLFHLYMDLLIPIIVIALFVNPGWKQIEHKGKEADAAQADGRTTGRT